MRKPGPVFPKLKGFGLDGDDDFGKDTADLAEGMGNAAANLGKGLLRSRFGKWAITLWLFGVAGSLAFVGVVIWAIVKLVQHFTTGTG